MTTYEQRNNDYTLLKQKIMTTYEQDQKRKAKWAKIWQIIRDIILALLTTETITEIIKS